MRIRASRFDDLKKARDDYDARTKELDRAINDKELELRQAQAEAAKAIETAVADMIGTTSLQLEIVANPWGRSIGANSWEVRVTANERVKFNDNVALSWNWEASLDDDGNVVKDSGSWSGLKVTTSEQIADLEESIRVIKILNNADWDSILHSPRPDYKDYVDQNILDERRQRKQERPEFEEDLMKARLEDLIGADVAIQLSGNEYFSGKGGIILTGMSDKFIKGYIFPWRFVDNGVVSRERAMKFMGEARTSKSKIVREEGLPIEAVVVD